MTLPCNSNRDLNITQRRHWAPPYAVSRTGRNRSLALKRITLHSVPAASDTKSFLRSSGKLLFGRLFLVRARRAGTMCDSAAWWCANKRKDLNSMCTTRYVLKSELILYSTTRFFDVWWCKLKYYLNEPILLGPWTLPSAAPHGSPP